MRDQEQPQRFLIRWNPALRPLLAPFGGTAARSFVEIAGDHLRAKFGWLFNYTFPLDQIEEAGPSHWPWYLGLGWRTTLRGRIGLIGRFARWDLQTDSYDAPRRRTLPGLAPVCFPWSTIGTPFTNT